MVAQRIQGNYDCLQEMMKVVMRHADMTVALTVQIEGLVDQLQGGAWRGVGAEAFYAEMRELILPAMRKLQDVLQFAGEGTGKIHNILREAEEEAARLFQGEGEGFQKKSLPDQPTRPSLQPDCIPNPTPDTQNYVDAAKLADIDPVLLGMIVENELAFRSGTKVFPFFSTQLFETLKETLTGTPYDYSYGIGQVQGGTAMNILQEFPHLFEDYPDLWVDGALNKGRIDWFLFTDDKFNLRIAALYIRSLQDKIKTDLKEMGVEIVDTQPRFLVRPGDMPPATTVIGHEVFNRLLISAYRQGWGRLSVGLRDKYPNAEDRVNAIINTISEDHEHIGNVWKQQKNMESKIGIPLGCR